MKLPHGEKDPSKTYSMPDPDALYDSFIEARRAYYPCTGELGAHGTLTDDQVADLFALAEGYLDLTMYELGQECCVRKLRDIWRARRAKG